MADVRTAPRTPPREMMIGVGLVWLAVLVYAASNSIVSLLTDIGARNPVDGRNPITYCNLLFIGSLLSLVPMIFMFWRDWTPTNLRALTRRDWGILTLSAILSSALTPALFFFALEHTTVTNVVLVGRIEPPLFLLATVLILHEEFDLWAFGAGIVALLGAVLMIALRGGDAVLSLGIGELGAALATLSFIASTLVARTGLRSVPLGIFSIYRTALGTLIYFIIAMTLYGSRHFQDLLQPIVWKWVWIYAVLVIIIGQFSWNIGLKHARAGDVALATSFSPLAGILIAMLLLGEDPGAGLLPGAALILFAIGIGQYGRYRKTRPSPRRCTREQSMEHECRVNFKGA